MSESETSYLVRFRPIVDDWPAFAAAVARPLPVGVWARPGRMRRDELAAALAELGLPVRPTPWNPDGLALPADARPGTTWPYLAGLCHVQEEVATAAVRLLDPRPGERVLDLCAAPGNKTAQIATALDVRGTVVARELDVGRMAALRNAVERLGLLNVATSPGDGADPDFVRACTSAFDAVLADVPCTSAGTSRRSPRVLRRCSPERSRGLQPLQIRLLRAAVAMCRPGGRVVYATCTYAPEENEAVVDAVLRQADGTVHLRPAALQGLCSSPGLTRWEGSRFDDSVSGALRIWPHLNDTGGFFIAVLDVLDRPPWSVAHGAGSAASAGTVDNAASAGTAGTALCAHTALTAHTAHSAVTQQPAALGAPADGDEAIRSIVDRFGLPPAALDGLRFVRRNRLGLHALSADLDPPADVEIDSAGFLFLRDDGRVPKLTTAGALAIGGAATRSAVDVDGEAAMAFLGRADVAIPVAVTGEAAAWHAPARGYVIPRHQGHPLGLGFLDDASRADQTDGQSADRPPSFTVRSLYPKGWGAGAGT